MKIRFIAKDSSSPAGNCAAIMETDSAPARYELDDSPGYLVQVVTLTADEEREARKAAEAEGVGLSSHEAIGWIPANLVDGLES